MSFHANPFCMFAFPVAHFMGYYFHPLRDVKLYQ